MFICLFLSISCNFHFQSILVYRCLTVWPEVKWFNIQQLIKNSSILWSLPYCSIVAVGASSSPVWADRCYRAWRQTSGAWEELHEPELLERNQLHLKIEIHFAKFDSANHTRGLWSVTVFDRNCVHFTEYCWSALIPFFYPYFVLILVNREICTKFNASKRIDIIFFLSFTQLNQCFFWHLGWTHYQSQWWASWIIWRGWDPHLWILGYIFTKRVHMLNLSCLEYYLHLKSDKGNSLKIKNKKTP